uniref:fibronectin type III domain-containing protein n=1 Tax=Mangrovimonas aestuarii TaxID=3018443 RepID=UPI0023780493
MKKTTFWLFATMCFVFSWQSQAQFTFPVIAGPTNVPGDTEVTLNINDVANTAGVNSGIYESFLITVDWVNVSNAYSSEADVTVITAAGSVVIDPPTSGGASNGNSTTLTFQGDLAGLYEPAVDGALDLILDQSWTNSDCNWLNISVTLYEAPTCIEPNTLGASNVLTTSADLTWAQGFSETMWNIEWGVAGFVQGSGTMVSGLTSTTYNENTLSPSTTYEFYVQADCGSGDTSVWVGPFGFTTACSVFLAPFTEPFTGGATPNCWTEGGDNVWDYNLNAGYAATDVDDHTFGGGTNYAWMDGSDNGNAEISTLTSPLVDVSGLISPSLQFALFSNNTNDATINLIDVELYDGAAWNTVMNITNLLGAQWQDYFIDLSTYTITGPVQVRFTVTGTSTSAYYNDILLDDVSFDEMPTCAQPFNLMASAVTDTTVDLSWTEAGTATSWNIEMVTAGTVPTGTPTYTGVTNPYTVTGLTPVTEYEFYVQADCGAGDTSAWVGPISFTTECAAYIPEYLQDFATIIPQCWDEADNGDPTTGPTGLGAGSWGPDGFANNGFSGAYKINLYLASKSDWVLSPSFDLSTGGPYQVEFDFAIMQFGSSTTAGSLGSDDEVQFLISTDAGTTWTALDTWDNTSVVPAGGTHYVYDL